MFEILKSLGKKIGRFSGRTSPHVNGWTLSWQGILFCLVSVGLSTIVFYGLRIVPYNVNMAYILLTLVTTIYFGLGTGALMAVVSFLCFDYFFIQPYFSFFEDFQDFVTVVLFLSTALITNQLLGWSRLHSFQAEARSKEVTVLYELATTVISYIDREELLQAVLKKVSITFETQQSFLYLPDAANSGRLQESASIINAESSYRPTLAEAQAVFEKLPDKANPARRLSSIEESGLIISDGPVAYLPLHSLTQRLGLLVLVAPARLSEAANAAAEKRLLLIFANHVALAVEHARLIRETTQIEALKESDKLKSALLASVSHELRTPLTAIKTATASLLDKEIRWTDQGREEFLTMIDTEVIRLTGLVSNLLDLSKIESGVLKPNFGWYYLPEIIEGVVERLRNSRIIQLHPTTVQFGPDVPLTRMDFLQIDQVITNLLENAAKYSASGKPIVIEVSEPTQSEADGSVAYLQVSVTDQGHGINPDEADRIFEKFYRSPATAAISEMPGAGIGLAIARGIIEAHSGRIWVNRRAEGGSVFSFTLPVIPLEEAMEAPADWSADLTTTGETTRELESLRPQ